MYPILQKHNYLNVKEGQEKTSFNVSALLIVTVTRKEHTEAHTANRSEKKKTVYFD